MQFSRYFPATTWLAGKLFSRVTAYLLLATFGALLLFSLPFRIDDLIFEYHIHRAIAHMRRVHIDQTREPELLTMFPDLQGDRALARECAQETCYSSDIHTLSERILFAPIGKLGNEHILKLSHLLGARIYAQLNMAFFVRNDVVNHFSYDLRVNDGGSYPGFWTIDVHSESSVPSDGMRSFRDDSPEFAATRYFKWPDKSLRVRFTPLADQKLVATVFDLRLNCLWYLNGCQTVGEVAPAVIRENDRIENALKARLSGPNPCPESILARRARDFPDILLVQVSRVDERTKSPDEVIADFKLLKVLRGTVKRPLREIEHPVRLSLGEMYIDNPAIALLRAGNNLLMFPDSNTYVDSYCHLMKATPSAVATLEAAMRIHNSPYAGSASN